MFFFYFLLHTLAKRLKLLTLVINVCCRPPSWPGIHKIAKVVALWLPREQDTRSPGGPTKEEKTVGQKPKMKTYLEAFLLCEASSCSCLREIKGCEIRDRCVFSCLFTINNIFRQHKRGEKRALRTSAPRWENRMSC